MDIVLKLSSINKTFGKGKKRKQALFDLSLEVASGEVFGFLGPNGAGKSTAMKVLLNFIRPDSGTMSILGRRVGRDEFRDKIGYLAEFPFFYEHLTARETLFLSGQLSGVAKTMLIERIPEILGQMDLMEAADNRINQFSKGMKQRLGMANALIHDPEVLIFDEPMSGLDPLGRRLIKKMILEQKHRGKTVFFSSHILSDIEELCDKIGVVHKGCMLYCGGLENFLTGSKNLEDRFIEIIKEAENATPPK